MGMSSQNHAYTCIKCGIFIFVCLAFEIKASQQVVEHDLVNALSPLLHSSRHCVHLKLVEDKIREGYIVDTKTAREQIVIAPAVAQANVDKLAKTLKKHCRCVIGRTGGSFENNTMLLEVITSLIRLVPRHVVLLEGPMGPQRKELKRQTRPLIWKKRKGKVTAKNLTKPIRLWCQPSPFQTTRYSVYCPKIGTSATSAQPPIISKVASCTKKGCSLNLQRMKCQSPFRGQV